MKIKEIRTKEEGDLIKLLAEKREDLRKARFGLSGSKSRNVRESRNLRRDIAKIMTTRKESEIANTAEANN